MLMHGLANFKIIETLFCLSVYVNTPVK